MLKYLGLVLVMASWVGGYYLVTRWYDKGLTTISKHAASNREASRLFAIILVGIGLIFYYWIARWLAPHLQLTPFFIPILTITILCQVLTGVIPDAQGWRRTAHQFTAYAMAILYLPLSALIIASPQITTIARIMGMLLGIYMLIAAVLLVARKAQGRYLHFQASYIAAFQLVILSAAYL